MLILNKETRITSKLILFTTTSITIYYLLNYYNSKYHLKQRYFNNVWNTIGPNYDKVLARYKRQLFGKEAFGLVLDVGSGTGPTFKYLTNDNNCKIPISMVVAIEPNPFMIDKLNESISKVSSKFATKLISKTIQQAINDNDILYESFDTIICNLVLCSISNPLKTLLQIKNLLKPGGKLLFIEHVVSENKFASIIQTLFNPIWSLMNDGCSLTHNTDILIKNLNCWESLTITRIKEIQSLKHVWGCAIKKK